MWSNNTVIILTRSIKSTLLLSCAKYLMLIFKVNHFSAGLENALCFFCLLPLLALYPLFGERKTFPAREKSFSCGVFSCFTFQSEGIVGQYFWTQRTIKKALWRDVVYGTHYDVSFPQLVHTSAWFEPAWLLNKAWPNGKKMNWAS